MEYKLLNNDEAIPMLGLGTWDMRDAECTQAVKCALDLGYTHIDTAEMYGNEEAIGGALKGAKRDKLFITSKVWFEHLGYKDVISACEGSLARLGCEYLDLYLIHWPRRGTDYQATFAALGELHDRELINALGVSNFTISHLEESLKICDDLELEISVNQVEFHVGLYQHELLEFCDRNDIALTAYSPVCKGQFAHHELLNEIAEAHNKSSTQIALRWLVQRGIVAIPKASQRAHQSSNLNIFDFELSEDGMSRLDALGNDDRLVVPGWAEFE